MHRSDIRRSLLPSDSRRGEASACSWPWGPTCPPPPPPRSTLHISPGHSPTATCGGDSGSWGVGAGNRAEMGAGGSRTKRGGDTGQRGGKHGDKLWGCGHARPAVREHGAGAELAAEMPAQNRAALLRRGTVPAWRDSAHLATGCPWGSTSARESKPWSTSQLPTTQFHASSVGQGCHGPRTQPTYRKVGSTACPTAPGDTATAPSFGVYLFSTSSPFTTF